VIFNPDYDLTPQERNKFSKTLIGQNKKENTKKKILRAIQLNPAATQKVIAEQTDLSLPTIKRYWKEVKDAA
jgi:predicted HTH transcriptional regulator